jgi:hypothetical protein
MRKILLISIVLVPFLSFSQTITTRFEQSKGTQSPAYAEIIDWWKKLDALSGKVKMLTMGMSDAGFPLNLIIVSNNGDTDFESIHKKDKRVILINNGIHPGEPDGIDASMLMVRDIVTNKYKIPDNIVLAIIPVYNIGGCLDRSANYRVDQDGPEEFGFRGNSENLDLNRDFIKCDSKEAKSFAAIFHLTNPDVFVDNHVSDGADYQHIMTLLTSQHDKLGGKMGEYLDTVFEPALYTLMKTKGYDLVPYVNHFGNTPENGWQEFWDSPRFGSGYAALWNTFSFIPETHMLKPYDQRVKSTYALMQCFIEFTSTNSAAIKTARDRQKEDIKTAAEFPISWSLNKEKSKEIIFKGFASGYKTSGVSNLPRLYYDRNKPYEKKVTIFNSYTPVSFVKKPKAYVIPQGWWKVIDLLQLNKVQMRQLKKDTSIEVEVYSIAEYKASPRQYEMHHLNSSVKLTTTIQQVSFRKGDWYIPMDQAANHFLIETLEPQGEDSYFAWNFFDGILGQKEDYSDYHFEDIAAKYLQEHPDLQSQLEQKRSTDTAFAKNAGAQLDYVYQHSPYFEPAYLRYPVYRVVK